MQGQPGATITNVSSGLAFIPWATTPVYEATKAAIYSLTLPLRYEAAKLGVAVVKIVPPIVKTHLTGPEVPTTGEPVVAFTDAVLARLAAGELEISYGSAEVRRLASHEQLDACFRQLSL